MLILFLFFNQLQGKSYHIKKQKKHTVMPYIVYVYEGIDIEDDGRPRLVAPVYFGEGIPLKEIEELVRPFAGLKTLIIERDSKCPMPEFRAALKTIL